MAAVQTSGERIRNRLAIAAVLLVTLIFLSPIYWITSTAFKARNLTTTVPPTVVFEPEISPFVKLFTKRSQLREQPSPEDYAAAPWWERLVFDGGEKVVRSGKGEIQVSGYPSRFINSLIIAITSTCLRYARSGARLSRVWGWLTSSPRTSCPVPNSNGGAKRAWDRSRSASCLRNTGVGVA
jgi:multiple sugar transport system permease protein